MVFISRPDVLLVTLSLCVTMVVGSDDILAGDVIKLQSAPDGNPINLWINSDTTVNTENDYTLYSETQCHWCQFKIMGESVGELQPLKNNDDIGLRLKPVYSNWMSCMSNGRRKGDKCRTRTCPGRDITGDGSTCTSEVFRIVIRGGSADTSLQDGQIVQLKNLAMNECVNNRKWEKVDMHKCSAGSTYWKIQKLNL